MADTPETDKNCWREGTSEWVAANFARNLERERNEWRECAEKLVNAFEDVPHDPFTIGWSNAENCKIALAEFGWMKEDSK